MNIDAIKGCKKKFEIQQNLTLFSETKYLIIKKQGQPNALYVRDIFENAIKTHKKLIALFSNNFAIFSVYLPSVINLTCDIKPRSYYSDCT